MLLNNKAPVRGVHRSTYTPTKDNLCIQRSRSKTND